MSRRTLLRLCGCPSAYLQLHPPSWRDFTQFLCKLIYHYNWQIVNGFADSKYQVMKTYTMPPQQSLAKSCTALLWLWRLIQVRSHAWPNLSGTLRAWVLLHSKVIYLMWECTPFIPRVFRLHNNKKGQKWRIYIGSYSVNSLVCQHLFNTTGFAGSNPVDNLELFSIVDAAADAWVNVYDAIYHEKNEELKVWISNSHIIYILWHYIASFHLSFIFWQKQKTKKLHENYLPEHMARFEKKAAANSKQGGWVWGEKVRKLTVCIPFLSWQNSWRNCGHTSCKYVYKFTRAKDSTSWSNVLQMSIFSK